MKSPLKFICVLLSAGLTAILLWSLIIEPNRLVVKEYDLKIKKWSSDLDGFKIVAIADIHGGSNFVTEDKIREVVSQANRQHPDIIVLLGDYLSKSYFNPLEVKMPIKTITRNLQGLQAEYGVYAVIGNHDNEFKNINIRQEFENIGYRVLENEIVSINKNGQTIRILGIHDILKVVSNWNKSSRDLKSVIDNYETKEGNLIVLGHNPDSIVYMTEGRSISNALSIFLAGHTHGGQCRFPIIGAPFVPSEFGQKYASGHIQDKGIDMFVTPGIGMSFLPVRFGVPPEISVIRLYSN